MKNQGIATALLALVAQVARDEDRQLLLVSTDAAIPAGRAFVERLGGRMGVSSSTNQTGVEELNHQMFRLLYNFDLGGLGHNTVDYLNVFIQADRHAFADRYRYLGDWEHVPVPLQGMLSREYNRELARKINLRTARPAVDRVLEPWASFWTRGCTAPGSGTPQAPRKQKEVQTGKCL